MSCASGRVSLRKAGKDYQARCPFHEEKTPSFSIDPEKGLYYCFGCHQGGDASKFVMQMERLSFPEAVERLARSGVPYISILSDPTTGGVFASFAALGDVNIADPVHTLNFLFGGGPRLPAPYPILGADRTEDELLCSGAGG